MEDLCGRGDLPPDIRLAIQRILDEHAQERTRWQASEARLRGILDHSPTIVYIRDIDGRYVYVNRRFEELVGRPRASIEGRRAEDLFPPEIAVAYTQLDERVLASRRSIEVEQVLPTPEGDIRVASIQFVLSDDDGQPTAVCGISLDITARVRAEAVLAARERHYRQILDNLRHGVLLLGPDGSFLYANPAARWLWGIETYYQPGLNPTEVGWTICTEDGEELPYDDSPLVRAVRDACPVRDQVIGLRRGVGPVVRWLTVDSVPVFTNSGELRAAVVSLVDCTDRVLARSQLAQSEALHRSLVTHLPDLVALLTDEGIVEFINRGIGDRSPEALVGASVLDLVAEEQQAWLWSAIEDTVTGGEVHNLEYATPAGVHLHLRLVPVGAANRGGHLLIIAQDVTERYAHAEALRASAERFRSLIEHTAEVVFRVDSAMRLTFVSPAVTRLLGYAPDNLIGRCVGGLIADAEDLQRSAEVMSQCWSAEEGTEREWTVEATVLRADQRSITAEVSVTLIRDAQGRPREVQGVLRDITARRRAEEALRATEAAMQRAQRLESLAVLAGGVAHDFNNLLMGVIGNADLLLGMLPEDSPALPLVDSISRSALAASELSRQMLALSGRGSFAARPLDLARHLAGIRTLLESSVGRREVLVFRLADDLPPIHADPTQVTRVALNLVMNAVEALPPSGGTVEVQCGLLDASRAYLDQAYPVDYELQEGPYAFLRVTDDGHGMSPEELDRAVEPFYTTRFAGRGLGLAVTLGLVRAHRGAFVLESSPRKGTTATVLFPPAPEGPEPAVHLEPRVKPQTEAPMVPGTVLVADDEPVVLEIARMALSQAGYHVVTADDGEAAVRAVEEATEPFHLVILDMTMPRLSGEEALRRIRSKLPDVSVIVSTGYSESEAVDRFGGLGISGYLPKPYRPSELISMVRDLVRG